MDTFFYADIHYPKRLHESSKHMAPLMSNSEVPILLTTLFDKNMYIYKNLKQVLNLGWKVKTITCVLKSKQSCWMKDNIDLNTEF